MRNKLALAIALMTSMHSAIVSALSMGDLVVESKVNEPLVATIQLEGAKHLSSSQILVQLAGTEDFRRANVERPFFLTGMEFKIETSGNGQPILRLTTSEKVTEPYLNFILDTRWPNGRVMREYLALLDLPVHSSANSGNAQSTKATTSSSSADTTIQRRGESSGAPQSSVESRQRATSAGAGNGTYRVSQNDTAWEIAEGYTPSGLAVEQTLYAIHQANPSAFVNGDVNLLKNGSVLRVPDEQQIQRVNYRDAKQWQLAQHAQWKGGKQGSSRGAASELAANQRNQALDGSKPASDTTAGTTKGADDKLTLTAQIGGEEHLASASKSLNDNAAGVSGNGEPLLSALEKLDRTRIEKEALDARYATLQERFSQLEKLVALKNAQLAELTASVEKSDQILTSLENGETALSSADFGVIETGESAGDQAEFSNTSPAQNGIVSETDESTAEAAGDVDADAQVEEAIAGTQGTQTADNAELAPETPAIVKASSAFEGVSATATGLLSTISGIVKNNLLIVGGVLTALIAAFAGLIVMRRRGESADVDFANDESAPDFEAADFDIQEDPTIVIEDDEISETMADEQVQSSLPEGPAAVAEIDEDSSVSEPLAEVDIYLSYGRHDQAIESLKQLLEQNETSTELQLKLVEVYRAAGDLEAAQQAANQLLAQDPTAESRINDLLNDVADPALDLGSFENSDAADITSIDIAIDDNEDLETLSVEDATETQTDAELDDLNDEDFSAAFDGLDLDVDLSDESDTELPVADMEDMAALDGDDIDSLDLSSNDLEIPGETFEDNADESTGLDLDPVDATLGLLGQSAVAETASLGEESSEHDDASATNSIEDEIAAAYGDLDIDLSASDIDQNEQGEITNEKPSPFGNPSVEEVLGTDDIPTLDMSDTYLEDSPELANSPERVDSPELESSEQENALELSSNAGTVSDAEAANLTDDDLEAEYQSAAAMLETPEADAISSVEEVAEQRASSQTDENKAEEGEIQLGNEVATKLDLARAYLEMGDVDGARDVLDEVLSEGDARQQQEANALLQKIA